MNNQIFSIQKIGASTLDFKNDVCCDVDHTQHETFETVTGRWDKIGLFLSGLCAIHCLATPLLVLFLPILGDVFESESAHVLLALFVLPVGLFAFWSGYMHHRQVKVFILGVIGLALVGGASLLPHEWVKVHEFDIITITGSALLIVAHIMNRRACLCHKHA